MKAKFNYGIGGGATEITCDLSFSKNSHEFCVSIDNRTAIISNLFFDLFMEEIFPSLTVICGDWGLFYANCSELVKVEAFMAIYETPAQIMS